MAIFHCSIKIVSRGKGKSVVAAAAYRSGVKLTNLWDGMTHDYTRKTGIVHSEIILPKHAPSSFADRSALWNSVELYEKSNNAQLAREVEVALPAELNRESQLRLVREYCSAQFVSKGMCADFAMHDTGSGNPHAHILLTMRPLDEKGAWMPKSKKEYILDNNGDKIKLSSGKFKSRKVDLVDWNNRDNAELWRKAWAGLANDYLEQNGRLERIDHRSFKRQGRDDVPTVHIGVAASQMENKGICSQRGEINRRIKKSSLPLYKLRCEAAELKAWLSTLFSMKSVLEMEMTRPKPPEVAMLLFKYGDIEKQKAQKYSKTWQQKHAMEELRFITQAVQLLSNKGICSLEDFQKEYAAASKKIDTLDRRIKVRDKEIKRLQKLIKYADCYQQNKPIHDEYTQIRWKSKQEKYAAAHSAQLEEWDAANRFLRSNLSEMQVDKKAWQSKIFSLSMENKAATEQLKTFRVQLEQLNRIQYCLNTALRSDRQPQTKPHHRQLDR